MGFCYKFKENFKARGFTAHLIEGLKQDPND